MQLIQVSDMHITNEIEIDSVKSQITKLHGALKDHLDKNQCTVFCILGDIVNKGDASLYTKASEVLNFMKQLFLEFDPKFEFTPGNHDLCDCPYPHPVPEICPDQKCNLDHYTRFVKAFDNSYNPAESLLCKKYDDINLILASSVSHGNCKYGLIDIDALKNAGIDKPSLLITHHTFFSESDSDAAAIRNAYKLFDLFDEKEIIGVLHGHTHGYRNITIGNKCPVVGVGPFLKDIPNINHQVNLVSVTSSGIHRVTNFFYRKDLEEYCVRIVYSRTDTAYQGSSIEKVYNEVLLDTRKCGILPNLYLKINMPYASFNEEIERHFSEQIPIAALWQETENVPDSLYYNHGQYMQSNGITAIEFIINELKSKGTSSRAIAPLISFEMVVNSGDGFLPSFDLIQFGFMEEVKSCLHVTLYLRALEVNHFLRINLCEIYLLCKQIIQEIRSVETIEVAVFAFKAQYKESFGCFRRAELDAIKESEIAFSLQDNLGYIIHLLEDKKSLYETVVEDKGMSSFYSALQAANRRKPIKSTIMEQSQNILSTMEMLKSERAKTSNYVMTEPLEKQLGEQFDKIIVSFRDGDIYES